jgi:hypothetical protein
MTPTSRQVRNWFNAAEGVRRRTRSGQSHLTTVELVGGPVEMIGATLYGAVRCENGIFSGFACISVGPRGGVRIENERYYN